MEQIKATFARCKQEKRAALVAYFTSGYPTVEETVDIMLGLEAGGAGELSHRNESTDGIDVLTQCFVGRYH